MPRVRSPIKNLASELAASSSAIALFDKSRRLVAVNVACAKLFNLGDQPQLNGLAQYTAQSTDNAADELARLLAPPPQAFKGEACVNVMMHVGRYCRGTFLPLEIDDESSVVLAVFCESDVPDQPKTIEAGQLHAALAAARAKVSPAWNNAYLVGENTTMRRLREQLQVAAGSQARTLIVGRRTDGTEKMAALLATRGERRIEGAVTIDCALHDAETLQEVIRAISRTKKSSPNQRPPSLVLHEVAKLSSDAQQELQGFLQLPGFELHTIATTQSSLVRLVKRGKFSQALAELLGTLVLRVPPLEKRVDDLPLICQWAIEQHNADSEKQIGGLADDAMQRIVTYRWPGGIDELVVAIRHGASQAKTTWITAADLPERLAANWQDLTYPRREVQKIVLDDFLAEIEKDVLARALAQSKGNKAEAARLLGISRPRLLRRLEQFGMIVREEEPIDFQPVDPEAKPA